VLPGYACEGLAAEGHTRERGAAAAVSPEPSQGPSAPPAQRPEPTRGWCEREVEEELPGLRLVHARATAAPTGRGSPPAVRERLRELSNRWGGAHAINLRQRPVAAAYRVFFRHIGLDPDVVHTPIEEAMLARMMQGGFHSNHLLADALLIALVDTGVPVWALDATTLDGPLGIRASREGEGLGAPPVSPARSSGSQSASQPAGQSASPPAGQPASQPASPPAGRSVRQSARAPDAGGSSDALLLPTGQLVVADARSAVAVLFGQIAPGHLPGAGGLGAGELELFTLQVPGVPTLHVEEALWMCLAMLEGPW
jgi:hypothetical protein